MYTLRNSFSNRSFVLISCLPKLYKLTVPYTTEISKKDNEREIRNVTNKKLGKSHPENNSNHSILNQSTSISFLTDDNINDNLINTRNRNKNKDKDKEEVDTPEIAAHLHMRIRMDKRKLKLFKAGFRTKRPNKVSSIYTTFTNELKNNIEKCFYGQIVSICSIIAFNGGTISDLSLVKAVRLLRDASGSLVNTLPSYDSLNSNLATTNDTIIDTYTTTDSETEIQTQSQTQIQIQRSDPFLNEYDAIISKLIRFGYIDKLHISSGGGNTGVSSNPNSNNDLQIEYRLGPRAKVELDVESLQYLARFVYGFKPRLPDGLSGNIPEKIDHSVKTAINDSLSNENIF